MEFHKRLKEIMQRNDISQYRLSKMTNIGYSTLTSIISGETKSPGLEVVIRIAQAFGMTVSELIGETIKYEEGPETQPPLPKSIPIIPKTEDERLNAALEKLNKREIEKIIELIETFKDINIAKEEATATYEVINGKIPLLSKVAAGNWLEANENIIDWIPYTEDLPKGIDFALLIEGDSMEPEINNGDIVFVHKQESLETGDIGIFLRLPSSTGVCKKFHRDEFGHAELISINPKYKPIRVGNENDIIVGKVICKKSKES